MNENEFMKQAQQLIVLASAKDYSQAQKLISGMKRQFPEKTASIRLWQACLYALATDYESAVRELEETVENGYWWNPDSLRNETDLVPLHDDRRFKQLIQFCETQLQEEKKHAKAVVKEFGNPTSDVVVVALHWRASNIKSFSGYWLHKKALEEYRFVFIQSSQLIGPHSYGWDDRNIAKKDIATCLANMDLSNRKAISAGASQGAVLAIEEALERDESPGFVAVVPAIKDIAELRQKAETKQGMNKSGFIVTGLEDHFYEISRETSSVLTSVGIPTELIAKEGLGHFSPADFEEIESKAICSLANRWG
ncbi:hypothetical protein [Alicyclobacillus sp. SO9]|uniref:TPR end-of-group domain-containing protein n=1 Tax=Alicyclobacillus sp. SO9 TaxID=2665646 RepID=UPI0018E904A4|nr:hypothetical protein [Alicyclobacillus sp. SO9]QQE78714.1 hypothetical protein GI364_23160 [Alicyclobacillus sp. SO9]